MNVLSVVTPFRQALVLTLLMFALSPAAFAMTISVHDIQRPEGTRTYRQATPSHLPAGKHPLIILLHGHAGSAKQILGEESSPAPLSAWLGIAERDGLLIIAPNGFRGLDGRQGWNDCRLDALENPRSDDVGFIKALIAREVSKHNADPTRVYVMGMSNGGMMAFRVAIELGSKIAGFATISASMAAKSGCPAPKSPVSALIISGTADPLVPYKGGDVHFISSNSHRAVISVDQSVATWRQVNGLQTDPISRVQVPHRNSSDLTQASITTWGSEPSEPQVELIRIDKGGHIEPSIRQRIGWFYTQIVGPQNGDLEPADIAWQFFRLKRSKG